MKASRGLGEELLQRSKRRLCSRSEELASSIAAPNYPNLPKVGKSSRNVRVCSLIETIDLAKDPYLLRTHLGTIECRLCLTLHTNEGSYLAHTQGKKHQTNLARRAARESKDTSVYAQQLQAQQSAVKNQVQKKQFVKIGSPGYQITKVKDPITGQLGLLFQIHYPKIAKGVKPVQRFMSAFEQQVETADREHQYLVVAAEPYQTVSFKIQSKEIDMGEGRSWDHWDPDSQTYSFQFLFA